jgi:hypothetical protein
VPRPVSLLAGLLGSLLLAAPASAAIRYAAPDGTGAEPCNSRFPCSLKKAVEDAPADGTEVVVRPGNYTYSSTIFVKKRLDLHGQVGEPRPRIAPAAGFDGQALNDGGQAISGQLRVSRLDIRSDQIAIHTYAADAVYSDLILTSGEGIAFFSEGKGTHLLRDSVARTTGQDGVAVLSNAGVVRLRNVTAYSSGPGSIGISARASCVFPPGGVMCEGNGATTEIDVLNTIAHGAARDLYVYEDPGTTTRITVGHSNWATALKNSAGAEIVDGGGNQTAPPIYQTGLISAFHQRFNSPTVNAGIADSLNGIADFDGDPRPTGSANDIGADEYVAPARADPGTGEPGTGEPGSGDPGTTDPGADPGGDPGGGGTTDTAVPLLTDLAIAPQRFRAAATGASAAAAAKTGATVVFTLSEPAAVSFRVVRRAKGRRSGKRCVKPTRRLRSRKRCARYLPVKGGFDRLATSGPSGFRFTGRIAGRKLRPGRYRLVGVAADSAGNLSKPARTPFRIVKR